PYVLLINSRTIAPFVRKNALVQFAHKYTDFNDLIGIKKNIWTSILEFLKKDGVKKIEFENIPENSETVSFVKQLSIENKAYTISPTKTSPVLMLPNTFEEYLASIREKRKKYRKFQREY